MRWGQLYEFCYCLVRRQLLDETGLLAGGDSMFSEQLTGLFCWGRELRRLAFPGWLGWGGLLAFLFLSPNITFQVVVLFFIVDFNDEPKRKNISVIELWEYVMMLPNLPTDLVTCTKSVTEKYNTCLRTEIRTVHAK